MNNNRRILKFGCITIISMCIVVFMGSYAYTHLAGEWATSDIFKIPPNSTFIQDYRYDQYGYKNYLRLYTVNESLQVVREWYNDQILMSPINGELSNEDAKYCSIDARVENIAQYRLLFTTALITLNPNLTRYESIPSCFSACVYKSFPSDEYSILENADFRIPSDSVVVALNTCWPSW